MALTIYLSPKAQQQAYREGLPAQAEQTYEVPPKLIDQFVSLGGTINPDGVAVLDAQYIDHLGASEVRRDGKALVFDTRPTDTGHALDLIAERVNDYREAWEAEEKLTAELANQYIAVASRWLDEHPVEELVEYLRRNEPLPEAPEDKHGRSTEAYRWVQKRIGAAHQRFIETVEFSDEQLVSYVTKPTIQMNNETYLMSAIWQAQPELYARAMQIAEAQKKQRDREITEWLQKYADDDTAVDRYAAGLMANEELVEWLGRIDFAGLNQFDESCFPTETEIVCDPDMHCRGGGVELDEGPTYKLNASEWRTYQAICGAMPKGATIKLMEHVASCLGCGAGAVRNAAHVTVRRWGVEATRRYSLTSAETDPLVDSSETCDRI